jgi:acetolactate synthase I/II/III large subunit
MRVADLIASRLADYGVDTCFLLTGGGAMHLNDAFGLERRLKKIYLHHEQACAIAAEGYGRVAGRPAVINVTSGPGGINALNGVFGAFTDSVPMVVVSGQVKRETLNAVRQVPNLRQLGDQEVDIVSMVTPITKAVFTLNEPKHAGSIVDEAFHAAVEGRPGPVWIDVPVDVQGSAVENAPHSVSDDRHKRERPHRAQDSASLDRVLEWIEMAKRPVIIAGSGVRISGMVDQFVQLAESLGVPVATAWTHDLIASDHPLFAGRPGTIGTRAGNFVVQNSDLVVILGSRLNIRQVSYNWSSFAKNARKIWVDIDEAEFKKPFVTAELPIVADLADFIPALLARVRARHWKPHHERWVKWCRDVRARYEPKDSDYPVRPGFVNSYHFIMELFGQLKDDDIVACGDATACIVPFQCAKLRGTQRLFSNSGAASMGYDLPAALGAAIAAPGRRVICLAGDGSLMLNVQELQSLKALGCDIKLFVLDNGGYLSIKQTQRNFFGRENGCSPESGLSFPNFESVATGFGLPSITLNPGAWRAQLASFLSSTGARVCVVPLDREQEFEPRLKSRMVDGVIRTPELDDMHPFLPEAELKSIRESALRIVERDSITAS